MGKAGLALGQRAHYRLAQMLFNLWEQEHIILYLRELLGVKKGVPAEAVLMLQQEPF